MYQTYVSILHRELISAGAGAGAGIAYLYGGDGLVVKGVENSIRNFARLASIGMRETDHEIIMMMTEGN